MAVILITGHYLHSVKVAITVGLKIGSMEVLCLDLMSERLQHRDLCY